MQYNISKIARIVGLSSETIRLYEKKGILRMKKNLKNDYRTYGPLDIGTILRCRSYAQYGFSLSEAADLINECSLDATHKRLVKQELYLQRKIEKTQRILLRLQELNGLIASIKESPEQAGVCHLTVHPGIFRIDYHHSGVLIESAASLDVFPKWSNMAPLSFVSIRVPLNNLITQTQDYYVGLGILEQDASFLGVHAEGPVSFIPSGLAVCCILTVPGEDEIEISAFSPLLEYAKRHELSPAGDAFSRMIMVVHRNKEDVVRYYQIWLPVQ